MTLQFDGFDWDRGNKTKCQKHGLSIALIESLFARPLAIIPSAADSREESRFCAVGRTGNGRRVFLVFTLQRKGDKQLIRPISARYMHKRRSNPMKKKIPAFKSDRAVAAFVDKADLSRYDLSGAQTVRFEMKRKDKSINLRLPEELYDAVRQRATHAGLPYQRFIRLALEHAIATQK
jgi:uncharacterized protein